MAEAAGPVNGESAGVAADHLEQGLAVPLELDRPDARDREQVTPGPGPIAGDGFEGRVVEDHVRRHARRAREVATPFQLQVSLWLPAWLTVPVEAVMVTASSKSENVPVLWASVPSGAVTALWSAATVGATAPPRDGRAEGRTPPQDLDAEQSVLGSILTNSHNFYQIVTIIRAEDFFKDAHRAIFSAITALAEKGVDIDTLTLKHDASITTILAS